MALRPSLWLPNTSYQARDERLGMSALWYGSDGGTDVFTVRSGVIVWRRSPGPGGPFSVVAATGLTANVNPGQLVYQGPNSNMQGAYIVTNDATTAVTFQTADPTYSRIDTVYVYVTDAVELDSSTDTQLLIAQGTPAQTPVRPTLPTGAFPLADVTIPAGSTSLGTITDRRLFTGPAGTAPLMAAAPVNAFSGQEYTEMGTNRRKVFDGAAWRTAADPGPWIDYSSSFSITADTGGAVVLGNASVQVRYQQLGKTVNYEFAVLIGSTTSNFGNGGWSFPVPVAPMQHAAGAAMVKNAGTWKPGVFTRANWVNGNWYIALAPSGLVGGVGSAISSWAANDFIRASITYEAA